MGKINIIGLGPGSIKDLTMDAVEKINSENENYLRTENHPTVEYFKNNNILYSSFDYVYEEAENFEEVYSEIVDKLLEKCKGKEINYFVPGNPLVAENTVKLLLKTEVEIEVVSGLSFIEPILELMEKDPVNGFQLVDGIGLKETDLNINQDTVITQVYDNRVISNIKLVLSEVYGDEYEIYFIQNAGIKGKEIKTLVPIYELDRKFDPDLLTSLYVPKKEEEKIYGFNNLLEIMEILRSEDGCSWDKKQDHKSLRGSVIEEAYELAYAIDEDDIDNIIEELGDVLLQVLFHSQIGRDEATFSIYEVMSKLGEKLIYRHPHIFSNKNMANSDDIVYNWDVLKYEKRNINTYTERLKDIKGLPSLLRSYKIQKEMAKIGYSSHIIDDSVNKGSKRYEDLVKSIDNDQEFDSLEEKIGSLLFSLVEISYALKINPEVALDKANKQFIEKVEDIEEQSMELSVDLKELLLKKLD